MERVLDMIKIGRDEIFGFAATVSVRITAPIYWWREFVDIFDTALFWSELGVWMPNGNFTDRDLMHQICERELSLADFSCENLGNFLPHPEIAQGPFAVLKSTIDTLNACREGYLKEDDKYFWHQITSLIPSSYNQSRLVMLKYNDIIDEYRRIKLSSLDEWKVFCKWAKALEGGELIITKE